MAGAAKTKARKLRVRKAYRQGATIAQLSTLTGWPQSEVHKVVKDIKR